MEKTNHGINEDMEPISLHDIVQGKAVPQVGSLCDVQGSEWAGDVLKIRSHLYEQTVVLQ